MEKIQIGNKQFNVDIADTPEKRKQGLSNKTSIDKDYGMLFLFDKEQDEVSFTMKNTSIPLDIVFMDEDGEVISIENGEPHSNNPYIEYDVSYVLEVNPNSGIKVGDKLLLEDKENKDRPKMEVLDSKGKTQFKLSGGERIVSRKETKVLIRKAKKANKLKTDSAYSDLGRYLFSVFNKQDERGVEYV